MKCKEEQVISNFLSSSLAYFYYEDECENIKDLRVKPHVSDLDCAVNCDDGYYLDLDDEGKISKCRACPANTYSIAGGFIVDGKNGDWKAERYPKAFIMSCMY